jgi:hypothetical protein
MASYDDAIRTCENAESAVPLGQYSKDAMYTYAKINRLDWELPRTGRNAKNVLEFHARL